MKLFCLFLFFCSFSLSAQTDIERAEKLMSQKRYTESKSILESYIKMHPNDPKTIENLGDIAGLEQKWSDAIKYYKILKTDYPKNANYIYKYGGALGMKAKSVNKFKAMGMLNEIEQSFVIASKLDSYHIDSRWALVVYYLEVPGILGGSESKSQKYATQLEHISPVDGYLANAYIAEYFKRYKEAERNYLKANEIGKSKVTYKKLYDFYLNKLKDSDKAKKLKEQFEKII